MFINIFYYFKKPHIYYYREYNESYIQSEIINNIDSLGGTGYETHRYNNKNNSLGGYPERKKRVNN